MDVRSPLGEFLLAKRAQLNPDDVGLFLHSERRRVPGLRREELATLAGLSAGYYARLEQGQSLNASREVLDSLADALRLTDVERDHLHVLSGLAAHRVRPSTPPPEEVGAGLQTLLDAMPDIPALVTGRRNDVLAWNCLGHALFAAHLPVCAPEEPGTRPNMSRLIFLDGPTRDLYRNWHQKAKAVVGNLRAVTARNPGDVDLTALIGELVIESPYFARLWSEYSVKPCGSDIYDLNHPLVGELTVTQQTLTVTQEPNQSLIMVTAKEGTPSNAALRQLRQTCI